MTQNNTLSAKVTALRADLDEVLARLALSEKNTLLGEVVYCLDALAREYVFRGRKVDCMLNVKDISSAAKHGEITSEEIERWKKFASFLERKGWNVRQITAVTRPLRQARFNPGHRNPDCKREVTQPVLMDCAKAVVQEEAVDGVKRLIALVTEFAVEGRVLCGEAGAVKVVDEFLASA